MRGIFLDGCVTGLDYCTETHCGSLDAGGYFEYEPGETVQFSIGSLRLGASDAKEIMTPLDFAAEAGGRHVTVSHYLVVNEARFLIGLRDIDSNVRAALENVRYDIEFMTEPEKFETQPALQEALKAAGKKLVSEAFAKNTVRRCAAGIRKERDVKIPMKDGGYVLADVWRPLKEGKVPVVMCMGIFGKEFINGFVLDEHDDEIHQIAEDRFYDDYARTETKHFLSQLGR